MYTFKIVIIIYKRKRMHAYYLDLRNIAFTARTLHCAWYTTHIHIYIYIYIYIYI